MWVLLLASSTNLSALSDPDGDIAVFGVGTLVLSFVQYPSSNSSLLANKFVLLTGLWSKRGPR
jgi:hypothetical protein